MTSGGVPDAKSRWWIGVDGNMSPINGLPGATASEMLTLATARDRSRTMGRAGDNSCSASTGPISARPAAASRSATITANGLSGRCLRCRSRPTASSSVASQARWKPPRPLIGDDGAAPQCFRCRLDRIDGALGCAVAIVTELEDRPAVRARDRLCVVTAIRRVRVLAPHTPRTCRSSPSSWPVGHREGR